MRLLVSLSDQSFKATKSVGIFNVSLGLARALIHTPGIEELHILGNDECAETFAGAPSHVKLHRMHTPVPGGWKRLLWDQLGLVKAIRAIRPDWALLPKGFPPYCFPCGNTRLACYVHDIIWEHYEQLHPEQRQHTPFPPFELRYFRTLGLRALAKADLILTSSQFNRERFAAHIPAARTEVVGIGFDTPAATPTPSQGSDLLLYVSPYPHKLTAQAIRWLTPWLAEHPDTRVHLIGTLPDDMAPAVSSAQWIRHGRIHRDELTRIMTTECRLSIYVSAYEGYGMPPIESLMAGLPCLASDIPPIRENIPADCLFPNSDHAAFLAKLDETYARPQLTAPLQLKTWDEIAAQTVRAMQKNK